jgi:3-oxoacyl-(acyl-carrier-protein) synthase
MKNVALLVLAATAAFPSAVVSFAPTTPALPAVPRTTTCLAAMVKEGADRVVVTGLGVISGCGIGADDFFKACLDGTSSLARVQRFDVTNYPCQIASEVPAHMFDAKDHFVNPKNAKSNDRFTHFAVAAARQALKDANLGDTPETLKNPSRVGVMVGSAFGGMETFVSTVYTIRMVLWLF